MASKCPKLEGAESHTGQSQDFSLWLCISLISIKLFYKKNGMCTLMLELKVVYKNIYSPHVTRFTSWIVSKACLTQYDRLGDHKHPYIEITMINFLLYVYVQGALLSYTECRVSLRVSSRSTHTGKRRGHEICILVLKLAWNAHYVKSILNSEGIASTYKNDEFQTKAQKYLKITLIKQF